ncbi:MAG TPA: carbohydrate ABC transporter permease [Candidatus Caenarcaniphilales bacterium]|nr:carbohydrate ABC transporter permease [Candidatus Caenarcaniphilales bacterium]
MAITEERIDRSFVPGIERPAEAIRPSGGRKIGRPGQILFVALLLFFAVVFTYPMVWLVSASFKSGGEVFTATLLPSTIQWDNYSRLLEEAPSFGNWVVNSVIVSGLAGLTVTLTSAFVAFGFAYFRFPYRNLIFGLVLATMMLPGAVTMIPTFIVWRELGFYNTLVPLWAGGLFASAFYIFMLRQFFLGLPRELFEAARVDGAGYIRMWRSVALPLTTPALIVVFVFELKATWTDLLKPLIFLRDVDLFTLPRGLLSIVASSAITGEGHFELLMAAAVITTVPMVVLFFLGQRYFVEGIATTGSKG